MKSPFELDYDGFESMVDGQPLDNDLSVATPENIAFQYRVAGPFRRMLAYAFDVLIVMGIAIVVVFIAAILFSMVIQLFANMTNLNAIGEALAGMSQMLLFLFLFTFFFFYGAFMETRYNGQSFGKMIFGIRVLGTDGRPINAQQAVLRNLVRYADILPPVSLGSIFGFWETPIGFVPTCLIAFIVMMFNRRYQRLGDLICRTVVAVDTKPEKQGLINIDDKRVRELGVMIPHDFVASKELTQALAAYVDRRPHLSLPRLMEIAKHLGEPLLELFGMDPRINHDLLLCALYYRSFNELKEETENYEPPGIQAVPATPIQPSAYTPYRIDV